MNWKDGGVSASEINEVPDHAIDQLVDSQTYLTENGPIWLLTPKVGRDGHVEASDIQDAAPTAGLSVTSTIPIAKDWIATRIAPRHAGKPAKKK